MTKRAFALLRSNGRMITFAVFLLAFLVRLLAVWWLVPEPAWDGVLYERGAVALSRGMGYVTYMYEQRSSDTVATAYYPVGYPAFLALCYKLLGTHRWVLHGSGVLLSSATVALAHRLSWQTATPRAATITAIVCALMPGSVLFAGSAMTEPLFGFLLALVLWLALDSRGQGAASHWCLVGVALAAATLVRPQAVLLAPLLPSTVLWRTVAWRRVLLYTIVLTASSVALVLPWTVRNCAAIDGCAFVSTNGGSNLAIGAVPRANGRYLQLTAEDGCRGVSGETARDRCWRQVALENIRAHPLRWLKLGLVKLDHTLAYEAFPLGYLRQGGAVRLTDDQERFWRRVITGPWRVFALFALISLVSWRGRAQLSAPARAAAVLCAAMLATHFIFFGGDRYHLPLVSLMAPLVATSLRGIDRWWRATL
jgi:4-amino-4-deoxy-L-arabinose transferase-like glycosyltransferase